MGIILGSTQAFLFASLVLMLGAASVFGAGKPSDEVAERLLDLFIWYTPET